MPANHIEKAFKMPIDHPLFAADCHDKGLRLAAISAPLTGKIEVREEAA